jgi:hypothetical protein
MALDFTTGVLDPRVTVTRALNTATRVNSSGYIETVNANLPRFDYNPTTLAPKGLLIEEMRQNLVLQSANMAVAPWVLAGAGVALAPVVTANAGISPSGLNDAVRIQFDCVNATSATNRSRVTQTITVVNGTTYSRGVWIKAYDANSVGKTIRFATDSIGVNLIYTLTNQWVRINPAAAAAVATSSVFTLETRGTVTGQTADVLVWNATLEAGAFLTSDIITDATSLTRNADVVSMTGTNFSDWYNAGNGAILARSCQSVITGTRPSIYMSDGTANNIISLRGLAANPELYIKATTDQAQIDAGTLTANSSFGLVGAWTTNNCAAAINGGAAVTDTSATIPTVDRLLIGSDGTNYLNGQVERISYWPQRIINAEVQAFSK